MSSHSDTASNAPEPAPTTPSFCADDPDLIIRAKDIHDFPVNMCILSFASPFFKHIFAETPPSPPDVLPYYDVEESSDVWENILRTIYPVPNPTIDDLDDLEPLLLTAKKFEMNYVIYSHLQCFENRTFIREDPLRLYAIACEAGLEKQAKHVASQAELWTVVGRSSVNDLASLTLASYHRLVSFVVKRDRRWEQMLTDAPFPKGDDCSCTSKSEEMYTMIKKDLGAPHFSTDEIYLKSLERSSFHCTRWASRCALATAEVRGFIDSMAAEKDKLCDTATW